MIEARGPDIVIIYKRTGETTSIAITVSVHFRVRDKENGNIRKYQYLVIEIGRMWKTRAKVVAILNRLAVLGIEIGRCHTIEKAALLGTVNIFQRVLSI